MTTTEEKLNSTDQAIQRCELIISSYSRKSNLLALMIILITSVFIVIVALPIFKYNFPTSSNTPKLDNDFIEKLNGVDNISNAQYDSLITKAVMFQKLVNTQKQEMLAAEITNSSQKQDFGDFVVYGIFILIFGVLTSLYRFHLKEISKQEHYLLGFQRIRIAAVNSSTKYDDEVKIALTRDAFYYDTFSSKGKKVDSPIQGHPTSDIATDLINKFFDKIEIVSKSEKAKH
jgi:hypothetical protein